LFGVSEARVVMSSTAGLGANRPALAPAAGVPIARSWRRGVTCVSSRVTAKAGLGLGLGSRIAPSDVRCRNLGFGHALVTSGGGNGRHRVVTLAKKDDKLQNHLNDARKQVENTTRQLGEAQTQLGSGHEERKVLQRDLEQARKEAREAEALFAAAADERAAKVKELVTEIDHWHDAATLAQQMEQEARGELDEARRQLNETGGRAEDAQRSKDESSRDAETQRQRVGDLERAAGEATKRADKATEDVRLQDIELDRLRQELGGLRGELSGARGELEKWADEVSSEAARGGADALMELERLKNKHEEDKTRWKRAAASAEEALLRDKETGLSTAQGALVDAERRVKEAEDRRKRAEESGRLFAEQHGHKQKELEQRCVELQDAAEKKEWYLGEARAEIECAREELEKASGVKGEVAAALAAAREETVAAELRTAERDAELVTARGELREARSMLEAVADGVESATMEAAARMRKADERVREVHTSKAEADVELDRLKAELEEARARADEAEAAAERRVDDAKGRTDEAWAAAEEKGRALDAAKRGFEEHKASALSAADEATLRVHQAEHRADSLKAAIEQKERDAGRLREDLAAARDAAYEGGASSSSEATERALRGEERAAATADEARAAAISAQEKLERAKRLELEARRPETTAREATERLLEAEGKVDITERGVAEKAEELKEARNELSKVRQETTETARESAKIAEKANERVLTADAATRRAESELARFNRDLDSIAAEIKRSMQRGDHEVAKALEGHQQQGFEARDAKHKQIEGFRGDAHTARSDARDTARDAYARTDEGQRRVKRGKERVDFLTTDLSEGKNALEKYRGECARLASVRDEAARGSFRAENECLATARDAAETAAHAVEKMRVSEAAAAKAYDVASLRERVLRDELDKAVGAGRSDDADGISTETQRRIQDAKNTCDWAAGLEEGRKAQERSVEEAKRLLIVAEDRARETLKDAGDTYGEFARMTEGSYFISQIYYIHHKCPVPPDYSDLNPPYSTPMRRATRD
jgi:chromosome segregation ATPase